MKYAVYKEEYLCTNREEHISEQNTQLQKNSGENTTHPSDLKKYRDFVLFKAFPDQPDTIRKKTKTCMSPGS